MVSVINYGKLQLKSLVTEGATIDGMLFKDIAVYGANAYQYTIKDSVSTLVELSYLNTRSSDLFPHYSLVYVSEENKLYLLDRLTVGGEIIQPIISSDTTITGVWREFPEQVAIFYVCLDINDNLYIFTRYGTKLIFPFTLKGIDFNVGFLNRTLSYGGNDYNVYFVVGYDGSTVRLTYFTYDYDNGEVFINIKEIPTGISIRSFYRMGFFETRIEMRNNYIVSLNIDYTKSIYEIDLSIVATVFNQSLENLVVTIDFNKLQYSSDFINVFPVGVFISDELPYILCEVETDQMVILKKVGYVLTNLFENYSDKITQTAYMFDFATQDINTGEIITTVVIDTTQPINYKVYGKFRIHTIVGVETVRPIWYELASGITTGTLGESITFTNTRKYDYYKVVVGGSVVDVTISTALSKNIFYERLNNFSVQDKNYYKSISMGGFLSGTSDYFVASDDYSYLFKVVDDSIECVSGQRKLTMVDENFIGIREDGFCSSPIYRGLTSSKETLGSI